MFKKLSTVHEKKRVYGPQLGGKCTTAVLKQSKKQKGCLRRGAVQNKQARRNRVRSTNKKSVRSTTWQAKKKECTVHKRVELN